MLPYETIIEKIVEQTKIPIEEIENKIREKLEQLAGLISKEGAAHIIANELSVKIIPSTTKRRRIADISSGIRGIELVGKVQSVYERREFQVNSRSGKVTNFILADPTGSMRIVAWGHHADEAVKLKPGDIVKIEAGYSKMNNERVEVHLNDQSKITLGPKGEVMDEIRNSSMRKKIEELDDNTGSAEVLATVVQVFEPRFYEICPQCQKRTKSKDGVFSCDSHGSIEPQFAYLLTLVLDDGTETVRTVFFRKLALEVIGTDEPGFMRYRDNQILFEPAKSDLIGTQILVRGRVRKNTMFDRMELIVDKVDISPDPEQELKRYEMGNAS